jgi:hypothetical protein
MAVPREIFADFQNQTVTHRINATALARAAVAEM